MERELIDLNELRRWKHKRIQSGECSYDDMVALGRFIEDVPRVDVVRGEWIYGEHDIAMCDGYRCDKCGYFVPWDYEHKSIDFINDYHFCPNCGANMWEGADDE